LELEVKSSSLKALWRIMDTLEQFNLLEEVELTTAYYPLLVYAKKFSPGLATGTFFQRQPEWLPLRLAQQHILDWATQLDILGVHADVSLLTPDFADLLHQHDRRLHGSNLDAVEQIRQGLAANIDGLSTGRLTTALAVRDS
jgi:hypothetical protein